MPHTAASRARRNAKRPLQRRQFSRSELFINHLHDFFVRLGIFGVRAMEVHAKDKVICIRRANGQIRAVTRPITAAQLPHHEKGLMMRLIRRLQGQYQKLDIYVPFVGPNYGITCAAWGEQSKPNNITSFLVDYLDRMFLEDSHSRFMAKMKEELMAAIWHPRKVEAWLEAGDWELVNMMAGEEN